jgi:hypothetical protein
MNSAVLVEQGNQMNWAAIVLKNLYSRLRDLFSLTKLEANRDNIEFNVVQVVNILLWNWFLIKLTSIVLDFEGEEGVAPPKT